MPGMQKKSERCATINGWHQSRPQETDLQTGRGRRDLVSMSRRFRSACSDSAERTLLVLAVRPAYRSLHHRSASVCAFALARLLPTSLESNYDLCRVVAGLRVRDSSVMVRAAAAAVLSKLSTATLVYMMSPKDVDVVGNLAAVLTLSGLPVDHVNNACMGH